MLKEFQNFLMKGNVLDLAVGVVIGIAFGAIIQSLVNDLINPVLGILTGGINLENVFVTLHGGSFNTLSEAEGAGAVTLNYGRFITAVIEFLIIGFALFIVIKFVNRFKAPPAPTKKARTCEHCCLEIMDKATRCPHCTAKL